MAMRARQRGVDIDDRLRDAGVVQHVLWPAVDQAGQRAVEVFHRRRQAHPVMCFELWHRDDQVGVEHGGGERETLQRAPSAGVAHVAKLAVVEVDEPQLLVAKDRFQAGLHQRHLRVADVAGPFADQHLGPPAAKDFGRGEHDVGMRADLGRGSGGLDKVRLQQDLPSADPIAVKAHGLQSGGDGPGEGTVVALVSGEEDGCSGREKPPYQWIAQRRRGHGARACEHLRRLTLQEGNENRSGLLVS